MGDLLIHEGAPCIAQQHAAKVFNADKTYFRAERNIIIKQSGA
jgi:arginine/lysine/ornithine decarboxylase